MSGRSRPSTKTPRSAYGSWRPSRKSSAAADLNGARHGLVLRAENGGLKALLVSGGAKKLGSPMRRHHDTDRPGCARQKWLGRNWARLWKRHLCRLDLRCHSWMYCNRRATKRVAHTGTASTVWTRSWRVGGAWRHSSTWRSATSTWHRPDQIVREVFWLTGRRVIFV